MVAKKPAPPKKPTAAPAPKSATPSLNIGGLISPARANTGPSPATPKAPATARTAAPAQTPQQRSPLSINQASGGSTPAAQQKDDSPLVTIQELRAMMNDPYGPKYTFGDDSSRIIESIAKAYPDGITVKQATDEYFNAGKKGSAVDSQYRESGGRESSPEAQSLGSTAEFLNQFVINKKTNKNAWEQPGYEGRTVTEGQGIVGPQYSYLSGGAQGTVKQPQAKPQPTAPTQTPTKPTATAPVQQKPAVTPTTPKPSTVPTANTTPQKPVKPATSTPQSGSKPAEPAAKPPTLGQQIASGPTPVRTRTDIFRGNIQGRGFQDSRLPTKTISQLASEGYVQKTQPGYRGVPTTYWERTFMEGVPMPQPKPTAAPVAQKPAAVDPRKIPQNPIPLVSTNPNPLTVAGAGNKVGTPNNSNKPNPTTPVKPNPSAPGAKVTPSGSTIQTQASPTGNTIQSIISSPGPNTMLQIPYSTGTMLGGNAGGFNRARSTARKTGLTSKGTSRLKIGRSPVASGLNVGI